MLLSGERGQPQHKKSRASHYQQGPRFSNPPLAICGIICFKIAFLPWLTLRFKNLVDPAVQRHYSLVGSAPARSLPGIIWFLPCNPGGLQTFPWTDVTSATTPCLVVTMGTTLKSRTRMALCWNDGPPVRSWYPKESIDVKAASHWAMVNRPQLYTELPVDLQNTSTTLFWSKGPFAVTFQDDDTRRLIAAICKEQNDTWFHELSYTRSSGMITLVPVSGETMSDNILSLLWRCHLVFETTHPFVFTHGETNSTPGRIQKVVNNMLSSVASWNRFDKCSMTDDLCGSTHCAIDSVVQRDRGVTTFHQEWIPSYLLQYIAMVSTHDDELTHIYIIKFYFIVVGHISVMGGGSSHGVAVLITALVSVSPRILLPIPKRLRNSNQAR